MNFFEWLLLIGMVLWCAYHLFALRLLQFWMQVPARKLEEYSPVTFFRPVKPGVPGLKEKLEKLAYAALPGDQILIGVDSEKEKMIADEIRAQISDREIHVIVCEKGRLSNPKINKLTQMENLARHELWVVSDSEAEMDRAFLEQFRADWSNTDVITSGYRFTGGSSWPEKLDEVSALLVLWPGLMMARMLGKIQFTLGACSGFHKDHLQEIGGWSVFGDELAEDYQIGKALSHAGYKIRLSHAILTLETDPMNWSDYWAHQYRVALTYRLSDPRGYLGMGILQGGLFGILWIGTDFTDLWHWIVIAGIYSMRFFCARKFAQELGFARDNLLFKTLLGSVVESVFWVLSWLLLPVRWGDKIYILDQGKLRSVKVD